MRRSTAFSTSNEDQQTGNEIDLTPMLDVVFIMLIFFIVTASFVKEAGIEVDRPETVTAEQKKNAKILIAVSQNNEIWIDKRRVDERSVKLNIERLLAENPKGGVVVQADNRSNAKTVALVLDAARDAGAADVAISSLRG
jgi:biopolymer transport protein ExbD